MEAIVAVEQNWGIGLREQLLFRISADLRRFRAMTIGGTVICGRKTLATLPEGRPLEGRDHIILSRNPHFHVSGATICRSIDEALVAVRHKNPVFVIGGGSVYEAFLPFCTRVHVTRVLAAWEADCWFVNLDADPDWIIRDASPVLQEGGLSYQFMTYEAVRGKD